MFTTAITRCPAGTLANGLTTSDLGPPDLELARRQHSSYVSTLQDIGLEVVNLEADDQYPDSHFVEDAAVVLPHVAVISRPGAEARRHEAELMAGVLERYRPLARIESPGTLDGGDVLLLGQRALIGVSERTNSAGAQQLEAVLKKAGWQVTVLEVGQGLHLKSGVNALGEDLLLVTRGFARRPELSEFRMLVVPEGEDYAANTLLVNDRLLVPLGFPRTLDMLQESGLTCLELDTSEFRKMDGGLTCLSLRF